VDNLGNLSGFAWSSGASSAYLNNDPGFGWIGFNQDEDSKSLAVLSTNPINPDLSYFCSTRLTSNDEVLCYNGSDRIFNFSAYYQDSSIEPQSPYNDAFKWKCTESSSVQNGDINSCSYKEIGVYAPTLEIVHKDGSIKKCASQATVRITNDSTCWVLVRKADSTSEDDFVDEITLKRDSLVEAKVVRPCISSGTPAWSTDGIINFSGGNMATFNLNPNATVTTIGANIGATTCTPAKVLTSDSMEWR
jgi:hypothetical protein